MLFPAYNVFHLYPHGALDILLTMRPPKPDCARSRLVGTIKSMSWELATHDRGELVR